MIDMFGISTQVLLGASRLQKREAPSSLVEVLGELFVGSWHASLCRLLLLMQIVGVCTIAETFDCTGGRGQPQEGFACLPVTANFCLHRM